MSALTTSHPILLRHLRNLLQGRPIVEGRGSIRPGLNQRVINVTHGDDFYHGILEQDASGGLQTISPLMMIEGHPARKVLNIFIVIAEKHVACRCVMFPGKPALLW